MGNTKYKSVREIIEKYHEFEVHLPFSDICQYLDEKYEIREKEEKTIWINIWIRESEVFSLESTMFDDFECAQADIKDGFPNHIFVKTIETSIFI